MAQRERLPVTRQEQLTIPPATPDDAQSSRTVSSDKMMSATPGYPPSRKERRMRWKLAVIVALFFTLPAWSAEPAPMQINDDVIEVARGGNEFATDLYAHLD